MEIRRSTNRDADAIMDQTIRMEQLDCLLSHLLS